jgi:DNA polymerase III subunit gamma/tau
LSNVSEAFLLYDEILEKGFDGHQFVVGLNEHFRNLMVSKDPQTVKLLQVAESIQRRYLEQSAKLSLGFIFSALSIGSQLDINYKSAKNQRLHVEIGLMKLSQVQQVLNLSELPNNGDEKKNINAVGERISSVDKNQNVQNTPQNAPKTTPTSIPPVATNVVQVKENIVFAPQLVSRPLLNTSKLRSTVDLETSVLNPKVDATQSVDNQANMPSYSESFTFEALQQELYFFADSRDNETLKVMLKRDFELEGTTLKLQLDNQIQLDTLTQLKQDLAVYLRQKLHNSTIQILAEIVTSTSERRPYTAQEKFEFLANKNPALLELREKLGLELVF